MKDLKANHELNSLGEASRRLSRRLSIRLWLLLSLIFGIGYGLFFYYSVIKESENFIAAATPYIIQSMRLGDTFSLETQFSSFTDTEYTFASLYHGGVNLVTAGTPTSCSLEMLNLCLNSRGPFFSSQKIIGEVGGKSAEFKLTRKIETWIPISWGVLLLVTNFLSSLFLRKGTDHLAHLFNAPIAFLLQSTDSYSPAIDNRHLRFNEIRKLYDFFRQQMNELSKHEREIASLEKHKIISQTTSQIAHDLKGPMGVFQKVVYGNQEDFLSEQQNLQNAHSRLISMADAIKRADLGNLVQANKCTLDLQKLAENLRVRADLAGIRFVYEGQQIDDIFLDKEKVERAFANLCNNAIEAASAGVTASWHLRGADLIIEIRDDGPGVPAEIQDSLFSRGATYGKEDGTGLGLSFVRHVAFGHGGEAFYKRIAGSTIFSIVLRDVVLVKDGAATEARQLPKPSSPEKIKVLVSIEDSNKLNASLGRLSERMPGVIFTSAAEDLSDCNVAYSEDDEILFLDDSACVKLIIPSAREEVEVIVRKIESMIAMVAAAQP